MRRERGRGARGWQPALERLSARLTAAAGNDNGALIEELGILMFGDEWRAHEAEAPGAAAGGPSPAEGLQASPEPGAGSGEIGGKSSHLGKET